MHFVAPGDLRALDARALDGLLGRTDLTVAMGEGEVRGIAAAALLLADYAVLRDSSTLIVDTAEAWAGAVWRLGRGALRWQLHGAPAGEIVDEFTGREPGDWLREWVSRRSVLALDSAAMLIRSRGGDRLERAEFARLFAIGEPQKGLGAFLAKTKPEFGC